MPELILEALRVAHLEPISLQVQAGELICLSGESGAGKSLLLKAIADIIEHDGEVYLDGEAASSIRAPRWRQHVALLPAECQWWYDTVAEHFLNPQTEYFSELGLPETAMSWQVSRCSTGEKQRLGLLRLLSGQPRCLLLDEPTGSLDPQSTRRVEQLVQRLCQTRKWPVIWVSHSLEQISRIADRHFTVTNGQLKAQAVAL